MKSIFTMVAGGTAIACFLLLLAAAVLVVVVIPAGMGVLTLELDRLKRGLRRPLGFLAKPESNPKSI